MFILYGPHINAGINYWSHQTYFGSFADKTNSMQGFKHVMMKKEIAKDQDNIHLTFHRFVAILFLILSNINYQRIV